MDNFPQFRSLLLGGLVSVLLATAGWTINGQATAIDRLESEVVDLKVAIKRLETLAEIQTRINANLEALVHSR